MNVQIGVEEQLKETLQKFWDLVSIGIRPAESSISTTHAKDVILKKFKETLTYHDGRYEVSLPWKEDHLALKDNYQQAERRLHNLEKKLLHELRKAASYREVINKYVENGAAEEVPSDEITPTDGVLCSVFLIMQLSGKTSSQPRQELCSMHQQRIAMVSP